MIKIKSPLPNLNEEEEYVPKMRILISKMIIEGGGMIYMPMKFGSNK